MKKIVLCALPFSSNLGENLVVESTRYLLRRCGLPEPETEVEVLDLFGRNSFIRRSHPVKNSQLPYFEHSVKIRIQDYLRWSFCTLMARLLKPFSIQAYTACMLKRWRTNPNEERRLTLYYKSKLKGAGIVWFAGGGVIEYCGNQYQNHICLIVKTAKEMQIPVVFNGVGLVGDYCPDDTRCRIMERALNLSNVVHITVRDHIDIMNKYLHIHKAALTADPATFSSEALGVRKKESQTLGIGLIRENAFNAYKPQKGSRQVIQMYKDLIMEMERRGYEWQLFTNGFLAEQKLGEKILAELGLGKEHIAMRPQSARELMELVSGFKGLLTARLHSCIAAYSMGIPSVALSWNTKVDYFMKMTGYPERAVDVMNTDAAEMVDRLMEAVEEGLDTSRQKKYRESILNSTFQALEKSGAAKKADQECGNG